MFLVFSCCFFSLFSFFHFSSVFFLFPLFSCNLFCVIQTFTSATHDCILLIRERRCSRGTELYTWLSSANSPWETQWFVRVAVCREETENNLKKKDRFATGLKFLRSFGSSQRLKKEKMFDDCMFKYCWECAWEQWFIYNMGKRWNNLIRTIEQKWCRDRVQVTGSLGYTIRESGGIWTVTRKR